MLTARRPQRTIARDDGSPRGRVPPRRRRHAPVPAGRGRHRASSSSAPTCPTGRRSRPTSATSIPRQRRTTIQHGEAQRRDGRARHGRPGRACGSTTAGSRSTPPRRPGCDGSSRAFVEALERGRHPSSRTAPREALVIDRPVTVREGDGDPDGPPGRRPTARPRLTTSTTARTQPDRLPELLRRRLPRDLPRRAGREPDLPPRGRGPRPAQAAGIGSRTTEADLLIFGPDGVDRQRRSGIRDECVRHKILDMVGDLALLGMDLLGHVVAHRSGHQLNAALVRKLLQAVEQETERPARAAGPRPQDGRWTSGAIMKILPHRYPFLLVDRVLELEPGRRVRGAQERHVQRAVLPGALAGPADHAGRPDHRGAGPGRRVLIADHRRPDRRAVALIVVDRRRQAPPAGRPGRPAPARGRPADGSSRTRPTSPASPGSATRSRPRPRSGS